MSDDNSFEPVLDEDTPHAALPEIACRLAARCVAQTRAMLTEDRDLSPAQIDALVARYTPFIEQRTIAAIESGWQRLQIERHGVQ